MYSSMDSVNLPWGVEPMSREPAFSIFKQLSAFEVTFHNTFLTVRGC